MFHDEGEAHRETISHAAERVISGRFFRPEIPAAGGGPSHCLEYGMIAAFLPIFREHGSSFTEPEISRVLPVGERAGKAGKARGFGGGLPLDNEQKNRPTPKRRPVVRPKTQTLA